MVVMAVVSVLANIPLTQQFEYKKCIGYTSEGLKVEVAPAACETSYLWGYLTGFLVGINTLLPAVLQISMNGYIVMVLVRLRKRKGTTVGETLVNVIECIFICVIYRHISNSLSGDSGRV